MRILILFGVLFLNYNLSAQHPTNILPQNDTLCAETHQINVGINESVALQTNKVSRIEMRENDGSGWLAWGDFVWLKDSDIGVIEVRSTSIGDGGTANIEFSVNGVDAPQRND